MLTRVAGRDVPLLVRFGGEGSPRHDLLLRFGPIEQDGSVRGHLLAEIGGEMTVVRNALVWDPVLRGFALGDDHALDRLADRLDPASFALGLAGRTAEEIVKLVSGLLEGLLSPGFILIGGIGTVIIGFCLYYFFWFVLAGWAFWHVILPGGAVFVTCSVVRQGRISRLRTTLLEIAQVSLGPAGSRQGSDASRSGDIR
jgi:hypothetical protein